MKAFPENEEDKPSSFLFWAEAGPGLSAPASGSVAALPPAFVSLYNLVGPVDGAKTKNEQIYKKDEYIYGLSLTFSG